MNYERKPPVKGAGAAYMALRFFGYSYSEIAEMTGRSYNTVARMLSIATNRVRTGDEKLIHQTIINVLQIYYFGVQAFLGGRYATSEESN